MKWSDWYRKKDNDEIDKWIKMWFTGTHSHTTQEYVPPAPIILLSLAIVLVIFLKLIDTTLTEPVGIVSFIILILNIINCITTINKINTEEKILSFSAIIISMLSIFCLYLKYIDISINILFNSISVIMFVIIQLIVNLRKRKKLNLQIKRIENANYEREFIFFEEETTKDIYFTEWDLGNKLKIGQTFRIDKLEGNQYHKEKIIIDNKEQEAYYLKKIDKEKIFNINK